MDKAAIILFLSLGFGVLFYRFSVFSRWKLFLQKTKSDMEDATRMRMLEQRKELAELVKKESFWYWLERELYYSGLRRRIPKLTPEWFLAFQCVLTLVFLVIGSSVGGVPGAVLSWIFGMAVQYLVLNLLKMDELRKVNDNLLKLLDFLGNYSITSGEISSVFLQISKYLEEPLKSVLEGCCYEARTTGDIRAALLSMEEKIEHPQFKELVRNMEITERYCADFTILVNSSRRSMREYLRLRGERKSMIREAMINMLLLLGLSFFSLLTADSLIDRSIWEILFLTWPGRFGLFVLAMIFLLFGRQVLRMNR